jgi:phytoene dehydrogenase-like protein
VICDYLIVGSGINGLVCAALLAKKGRSVQVLERSDRAGGCIRSAEITLPGFIHDVMSCWHPLFVTSPAWGALRADLERHGLHYCNTDAPTAVALPDGRHFILHTTRADNITAMNAVESGDGDRYAAALAALEQELDLVFALLGGDLWSWGTARTLARAVRQRGLDGVLSFAGRSLQAARPWLERTFRSEVLRACFAPWALHAGVGPEAPMSALMAQLIPWTLEAAGAPVPAGGGAQLVHALSRIIGEHGGEIDTGVDVERIVVRGGAARGVMSASGREYTAARGVIASVTPAQLYARLLPPEHAPAPLRDEALAFRPGRAGMQIHVALRRPPRWPDPALGRVALMHIVDGLDGVSRAVNEAECGLLPARGTIALGQPAALDPGRVPPGAGQLWIQILDLPAVIKGDAAGKIAVPADGRWTEAVREAYADRIMERVCARIPGLGDDILARTALSPVDLEHLNINLAGGDPYGGACTPDQMLIWRPSPRTRNHRTPVPGLYHIGASTHPGAGLGAGSGYALAARL